MRFRSLATSKAVEYKCNDRVAKFFAGQDNSLDRSAFAHYSLPVGC